MSTSISPELMEHAQRLELTAAQKDEIIDCYLAGNKEERMTITKMYKQAFADAKFVQLLIRRGNLRIAEQAEAGRRRGRDEADASATAEAATSTSATTKKPGGKKTKAMIAKEAQEASKENVGVKTENNNRDDDDDDDDDEDRRAGGGAAAAAPAVAGENNNSVSSSAQPTALEQLTARCRKLRQQIEGAVSRIVGDGPHRIRFGVVRTPADCERVVDLFAHQFVYPDAAALKKIVKAPQSVSRTRHRTRRTGNFCWYVQYDRTGEIACAASVNILSKDRNSDEHLVFELPLFATAAGFKGNGLARLLNAAIQELATNMKAELIFVSADAQAVPFWTSDSLGAQSKYAPLGTELRHRYDLLYNTEMHQFGDVELLGWVPKGGAEALDSSLLQAALDKAPKFVLDGPARLPLP